MAFVIFNMNFSPPLLDLPLQKLFMSREAIYMYGGVASYDRSLDNDMWVYDAGAQNWHELQVMITMMMMKRALMMNIYSTVACYFETRSDCGEHDDSCSSGLLSSPAAWC
mmetsp:Transcript_38171/g.62066  ORF Transcript_38171/g.62066 Transcript_38171/m.62066 type:complete len:110 (-) Transcript_38171:451-780(-)